MQHFCSELSFPADCRIKKRHDFTRLYRTGRRIALPSFVIFYSVRESGSARLGLTASRKVGDAVVRNRCKRRMREIFRSLRSHFMVPVDLSVVFRPGVVSLSYSALKEDFTKALVSSGLVVYK